MAGWTLLNDVGDWDCYRETLVNQYKLLSHLVAWGQGPKHYPCLVTTLVQDSKAMSCYLYENEAEQLIKAARKSADATEGEVPGHTMLDFAKSVAAHLMAFYEAMESLKITDRSRHLEAYMKFLGLVDQYHTEDKTSVMTKLTSGEQFILDRLFPQDTDNGCTGK